MNNEEYQDLLRRVRNEDAALNRRHESHGSFGLGVVVGVVAMVAIAALVVLTL